MCLEPSSPWIVESSVGAGLSDARALCRECQLSKQLRSERNLRPESECLWQFGDRCFSDGDVGNLRFSGDDASGTLTVTPIDHHRVDV